MKNLTPEEESRAEALRQHIIKKLSGYITLRDNAETKRLSKYIDSVSNMLITGKYEIDDIEDAVSRESLFLERFASIDRAYNEVNATVLAYNATFPKTPLPISIKNALQEMRHTHSIGLDTIIRILEDRTEQLLREIKK